MKIGIDARMYRTSAAGIGRYSQNLIKNLLALDKKNQYILFMTSEDAKDYHLSFPNAKVITTEIPHYSMAEQVKLPGVFDKEKVDSMLFLNFNYPVRYKGKFIVVIHDLTLLFYPQTARQTNFIKRTAFKYAIKKACQNSSKIIAVSEYTKNALVEHFKIKPEKIEVVYEAPDDKLLKDMKTEDIATLKQKYNIKEHVVLYVGQFRPHKNIAGLVKAFDKLRENLPAKLVLIGKNNLAYRELHENIDKSPNKEDIVMPGFVTDNELSAWYEAARVFVFPSFYEGFGLPGLEAMQAGVPVVSSKKTSLPEVFKDAAIYFDPENIDEMAEKIRMVLSDEKLRENLIEKGKIQAEKYSWKVAAQETLKIIKSVAR